MAQLQLQPPAPFNFRNPDDWQRWRRRFENFRVAAGLATTTAAQQVSTLLYCLGEEAETVLASTGLTEDERKVYATVLEQFDGYFKVRRNVIFERARFNRRSQEKGETAEKYITELYTLAENCNYDEFRDEMIRDRLVVGIRDATLSQQLQLDAELTLERAKTKIRQREAVGEQQKELKTSGGNSADLEHFHSQRRSMPINRRQRRPMHSRGDRNGQAKDTPASKPCTRCGRKAHPREQCPARDAICYSCNKKGHFGAQCLTKRKQVAEVEGEVDTAFLGEVGSTQTKAWLSTLQLNTHKIQFKLDTGAEATAISMETYRTLKKPKLSTPKKTLLGPSRQPLNCIGEFQGKFGFSDRSTTQPVYVIKGLKSNLLGLPAITALQLAARMDAAEEGSPGTLDGYKKQFPSLFKGLGNLGEPFEIYLKEGAVPHCIYTPRNVPLPLREKVKEELDRMETIGVIKKISEPTPWCAGMVVVPKKEGKLRICVDLKPLNESVLREIHPLPKVDETLAQLSGAKLFSKLDANSGFWQIPLAENSQLLTTFVTPFGRYHFTKMPFGISSAPEHFQKRMTAILSGLDGVLCLIDDVLIFGGDEKEHDERLNKVFERIKAAGATLNPEKCEFKKKQLKFLGHIIDENGIRPDPDKVSAINKMKAPTNVTELRRFMGMTNQLGKFSQNLAEITQPLRQLLSKRSTWLWGPVQDRAFAEVKLELTKPTVLALYSPHTPTKVTADASSYGLGAVIMQQRGSEWKPIAYASRSMTETETRYAQIEKEALATTWACERFSTYILGTKFMIETDHKPLVPLLGAKNLDLLPPRILRFRLRLARFDYTISHVPGKLLYTADTLSRAPSPDQENDVELQQDAETFLTISILNLPITEGRLEEYRKAQDADGLCSSAKKHCKKGWPEKKDLGNRLIPFWKTRGNLSLDSSGLLLYGSRIVVPDSLRRETLRKIHDGHQGIQRCRLRAKISVWWPGISSEIESMIQQCHTCAQHLTPRKEPMIASELPQYPWQKVGVDLFHLNGAEYLVLVDYFSRYPEVQKLTSTTSAAIIASLKPTFSRFGIPEIVTSDNGPQFTSQLFADFAKTYGFRSVTSSPLYAQSNGQVERTVQTVKRLLKDTKDPNMALLTYRSTPFPWCNRSPAELLMGRRLRGNIPVLTTQLIPEWSYLDDFRRQNQHFKERQKREYDNRHGVRSLPPIPEDSDVWITTGEQPTTGTVLRPAATPRSYIIQTPSGQIRRTRQHLNVVPRNQDQVTPPQEKDNPPVTTRSPIVTRSRSGTTVQPPDRL